MIEDKRRTVRIADPVRDACYAQVRSAMLEELNEYYREHKGWLLDPRSRAKLEMLSRVLTDIFTVLDGYELTKKEDGK
jgi:hypothetical protein